MPTAPKRTRAPARASTVNKTAAKPAAKPRRPRAGAKSADGGKTTPAVADELFRALEDDFRVHGAAIVAQVRAERPIDYLKMCAAVLPKAPADSAPSASLGQLEDMSDAELLNLARGYADALGFDLVARTGGDAGGPEL